MIGIAVREGRADFIAKTRHKWHPSTTPLMRPNTVGPVRLIGMLAARQSESLIVSTIFADELIAVDDEPPVPLFPHATVSATSPEFASEAR